MSSVKGALFFLLITKVLHMKNLLLLLLNVFILFALLCAGNTFIISAMFRSDQVFNAYTRIDHQDHPTKMNQ